jgi:hypothetical protein
VIISIIIATFITTKNNDVNDFNQDLELKLNDLILDDESQPPKYFHLDADLINVFYTIKQNLAEYNPDSYNKAMNAADIVLQVRNDIEKKLCASPKIPDSHDNTNFEIVDDSRCGGIIENAYENFQVARDNVNLCLNHLNSLVLNVPSIPGFTRMSDKVILRVSVILRRNLDIIKDIYESKNNPSKITDYDSPVPQRSGNFASYL